MLRLAAVVGWSTPRWVSRMVWARSLRVWAPGRSPWARRTTPSALRAAGGVEAVGAPAGLVDGQGALQQRLGLRVLQPLGQDVRVGGEQVAGHVVRGEEGADGKQVQGGWRGGADAFQRQRPDGGDGVLGVARLAQREQLLGALGEQADVLTHRGGGLLDVGGGLLQRQRQVPEHLSQGRHRGGLMLTADPAGEERGRLIA